MIKVIIEGPVGIGKTRMFKALEQYCQRNKLKFMYRYDTTEAALKELKPDVLFIERLGATHERS